ncbi:G-protein coupled receptor 35-like [Narcine bancroftii]|uniref:G-protein coupled receptor 35-like n=1 Tax=Narcine bancroftii TaxID=1343680 RepID=UPI003832047D
MCNFSVNEQVQLFQFYMYIPTFLLGLVFNAIALSVFCWKLKKWTETTIYMTNLAVADTIVLLTLPFKIYSYRYPWNFGAGFCAFLECLYFLNIYVSIYLITCISVDRYIAIKHPLKAVRMRSPMKAAILCGATWIFVCTIRISMQVSMSTRTAKEKNCFIKVYSKIPPNLWLVGAIEVIGFIIPAFILSFSSFQIIMTLCKRKVESYGNAGFGRTIIIIATNLLIFFICYLPFHVGLFVQFMFESTEQECERQNIVQNFVYVFICLANGNCCLDAIVYYFASLEVCDHFKQKKVCSKNLQHFVLTKMQTARAPEKYKK